MITPWFQQLQSESHASYTPNVIRMPKRVLIVLLLFTTLRPDASARAKVFIKGSVVSSSSAPVSGAWVLLQRTTNERDIVCSKQACKEINREMKFEERQARRTLSTFTDAKGTFLVKVPVGKTFMNPGYRVQVVAPGYHPKCQGVAVPDKKQGSVAVNVELKAIADTPLTSSGTGNVKLQVFDQTGAVVEGAPVLIRLNNKPLNRARPEDSDGLQIGETTSAGEFKAELAPGDYDVVLPFLGVCDEVKVDTGKTAERTYK